MDLVYLQCDMRYNKWLLKEVLNTSVVEYTITRCKKINCNKLISGIYYCDENTELIDVLKKNGVEVILSNEDDVNARFLKTMDATEGDYVVRIGADQVLIDTNRINELLTEIKKDNKDWFYSKTLSAIIPDIVRIGYLKQNKDCLMKYDRYFYGMEKDAYVNRYILPYSNIVLYNFRVNCNEGYRICRLIIENNLDVYDLSEKLALKLIDKKNYLNYTGILGSWILTSTESDFFYDEEEKINPWWGMSVIDLIKERIYKGIKIFEWGTGNSTLFWSDYASKVVSIEHQEEWYSKLRKKIPHNVELKYCRLEYGGDYCKMILKEKEEFDIVLIDGRDRVRCAKNAIQRLKNNGVIIWDNTERERYLDGYKYLREMGFKRLEIKSIIYGAPEVADYTSIFYRDKNILNL